MLGIDENKVIRDNSNRVDKKFKNIFKSKKSKNKKSQNLIYI